MKISGWGKYPAVETQQHIFDTEKELRAQLIKKNKCVARGFGRSYGDSSLAEDIFLTARYNHFIAFDDTSGVLTCEAGVSLSEIIDCLMPRGWFPAVTPGTKYVSIGGAIASDVHGKNHHHDGCFSEWIKAIKLMLPDGSISVCSKKTNQDLFHATCGGMGLTGIILEATIQLIPINSAFINQKTIKAKNLQEIFQLFEQYESSKYSVAWLDCLATGDQLGRSLLMVGEHSNSGELIIDPKKYKSVPTNMPSSILNQFTIKAFNSLYYCRIRGKQKNDRVHLNTFFYPLDNLLNWNNLYGKKGFIQYQCVIPKKVGFEGITKMLKHISNNKRGSFLSVLKLFGTENKNWLSFPKEGYTLALDFKMDSNLLVFLSKLDEIVQYYGGRVYLTKDSRMSKDFFTHTYPNIHKFIDLRKKIDSTIKFQSLQSARLGI